MAARALKFDCRSGRRTALGGRNAQLAVATWTKLLLAGIGGGDRERHVAPRTQKLNHRSNYRSVRRRGNAQFRLATRAALLFSGLFVRNVELRYGSGDTEIRWTRQAGLTDTFAIINFSLSVRERVG